MLHLSPFVHTASLPPLPPLSHIYTFVRAKTPKFSKNLKYFLQQKVWTSTSEDLFLLVHSGQPHLTTHVFHGQSLTWSESQLTSCCWSASGLLDSSTVSCSCCVLAASCFCCSPEAGSVLLEDFSFLFLPKVKGIMFFKQSSILVHTNFFEIYLYIVEILLLTYMIYYSSQSVLLYFL